MAIIRSQCGQCSVGCGIRAITGDDRNLIIEGDTVHPANGGLLCERGLMLKDGVGLDGRLLHPMVAGRRVGWDRAVAHIARRLGAAMARHGPGTIALHISGTLLTEDYYVANKLMKGFFGSAHIQAPWSGGASMAALQRAAFGEDVMPAAAEDIDRAQVLLVLGEGALRDHPILLERIEAARDEQGLKLILLTQDEESEVEADIRLPVQEGSMDRLLTGALLHFHEAGLARLPDMVRDAMVQGHDLWSVARSSGLSATAIRGFYDLLAAADHLVTLFDEGAGWRTAAAAINLHVATGRIGRPGATPFALSASANGMSGREVGCASDHLAAHRPFTADALKDVARFWGAPNMASRAGLDGDALRDAMRAGAVKALWCIGSGEGAEDWLREARDSGIFTIASRDRAGAMDDADVLLPSPIWIERDGTATGSDRLISRQRWLLPLPDEVKPDWWAMTRVAQAMGWGDAFHYERPADIYREHVRLTAYRNDGDRLLDLRRHAPISNPAYDELTPWRWGDVPFDGGNFPTPDGRARLIWPLDQPLPAIS
ncbi:molybdopterin-dependent oxidoreductase [Sphingobium sp.]|uniref:molybdopterin-dependent oxidoreductase n=1 Tax=Sphingobium sp. TaxID=1912891 RepID=UPI003B3B3011